MNLVRMRLYGALSTCLLLFFSGISCQNNAEESNSPTLVVEKYIQASLGNDVEGFLDTMTPSEIAELEQAYGKDYRDYVAQDFDENSIQMQAYDMIYEEIPLVTQPEKTIVLVTYGKLKYMGSDGNWVYPSYDFTYKGAYFDTAKVNGSWYIENLLEVGDMKILLSRELTDEELGEVFAFLATTPGVDSNSISFKDKHQLYGEYIERYPGMADEMTEEDFPYDEWILLKVTDLEEVLPAGERILDSMPYRDSIEDVRTFSASAVSARKQ